MGPNEAAELLRIPVTAGIDEVQHAYELRIVEAGADVQRRDAVTAARDALLAASAWQPPGGTAANAVQPPAARSVTPPPASPPPVFASPVSPPPGFPPPQPPYPAAAPAPWYPAPPARRGLSTGAIVGITLGSVAAGLVILLVALFTIVAIVHDASRLAHPAGSSSEAPFAAPSDTPSDTPSDEPTDAAPDDPSTVDDYDVDGVHVHYVEGWTFELTPGQTCAGATVTAGFSDTADGDEVDQWSTTVDLEQGIPLTFTIPDSASAHEYAGIDGVDCGQA